MRPAGSKVSGPSSGPICCARPPADPLLLVLIGPGGVGKGTVAEGLLARDQRVWLSRSWTTREPRPGERPDAYTYVDRSTFLAEVARGGFLEWAEFHGSLYGTPWPVPPPGHDVLLEIDLQGARQVKARHRDAVVVLLEPPSLEVLRSRLRARGDPEAQVRRRLETGRREVVAGRALADHVVVNDDLDHAISQLAAIVATAREGNPP